MEWSAPIAVNIRRELASLFQQEVYSFHLRPRHGGDVECIALICIYFIKTGGFVGQQQKDDVQRRMMSKGSMENEGLISKRNNATFGLKVLLHATPRTALNETLVGDFGSVIRTVVFSTFAHQSRSDV
mmetsp:Transcript_1108/g.3118  ORF Transcript_1108/g.3118 Transcript_1108/m.3118 type:complete len:128 (+) Transcript_1108:129-512(+)